MTTFFLNEENVPCRIAQYDYDTEYAQAFDDELIGNSRTIKMPPIKSSNLQTFNRQMILALKHDVFSAFSCSTNDIGTSPANLH